MLAEREVLKTGPHKFWNACVLIEKVNAGLRLAGSIAVPDGAHYSVTYVTQDVTLGRKFPASEVGRREAWTYFTNQVRAGHA